MKSKIRQRLDEYAAIRKIDGAASVSAAAMCKAAAVLRMAPLPPLDKDEQSLDQDARRKIAVRYEE